MSAATKFFGVGRLRPLAMLLCLILAGCVSPARWSHTPQTTHVVRSGESLFVIAHRYKLDHRSLARWNNLGDGTLIFPGQVIRLQPPPGGGQANAATRAPPKRTIPPPPSDPPPGWGWPTSGRVSGEFDGKPGSGTGLVINGKSGQPVRAAADGRVVYSGGGLIGYGQLLILKHNDTYLSAYGYNARLLVKEGERIRRGQRIATMGEGPGKNAQLHFEIRRNGKPVNPRRYLPRQ